mmetsp:Transcript_6593/g.16729  ORF Transcript_6593/g.16729 Transcript_6593/m.16729 type:complete len:387 (-) Transcript_6593:229-1389(-)
MAKADVDISTLTRDQIADTLANEWGLHSLTEYKKLYGGYSGSNYKVVTEGGTFCLKVANGYPPSEVEDMALVMDAVYTGGFDRCCRALPLAKEGSPYRFIATKGLPGPTMVLTFVVGVAADKVIEQGVDCRAVLRSVGENLARFHSVSSDQSSKLRTYREGGACLVWDHMRGAILEKIKACPHTVDHPYSKFYAARLAELQTSMKLPDLPSGPLHGDCFLDNVLADPSTGEVAGFVDLEDATLGPLIFDLAVCAIGSCFNPSPANDLDYDRLEALLNGYCSTSRTLTPTEVDHFVPFMRLALMCNCTWRFVNFNIDHREIADCRDTYVELQQRIVALEDPATVAKVDAMVRSKAVAPTQTKRHVVVGTLVLAAVVAGAALALSRRR